MNLYSTSDLVIGGVMVTIFTNCQEILGAPAPTLLFKQKSVLIHGSGCLPVHAGDRVKGLAVRMPLNKLEHNVLQFFLHLPDIPRCTFVHRMYRSA